MHSRSTVAELKRFISDPESWEYPFAYISDVSIFCNGVIYTNLDNFYNDVENSCDDEASILDGKIVNGPFLRDAFIAWKKRQY